MMHSADVNCVCEVDEEKRNLFKIVTVGKLTFIILNNELIGLDRFYIPPEMRKDGK